MKKSHYELPPLYSNRYPKLKILFDDFNEFLTEGRQNKCTLNAFEYIHDYYDGVRRNLEYGEFKDNKGNVFVSSNNQIIETDNNKSSVYTLEALKTYNLHLLDDFSYQNLDFLLLVIPILLNHSSKIDVLKFLFMYYLDERVAIKEGSEYLGTLDENYRLDDPRIKFRDDKTFQTFSYIIFHKSFDVDKTWIYKNIIPLSKVMGIYIELVTVNDKREIEYFANEYCNDVVDKQYAVMSNSDELHDMRVQHNYTC